MATPTHIRKLRADSKFAALTAEQQNELAELLLQGSLSHEGAVAWLAERGVKVSRQSVSEYYRNRVLPLRWRSNIASAATLARLQAGDVEQAAHNAIAQLVYELCTAAGQERDEKQILAFYKLMLEGMGAQQSARRLELLERRAAMAEKAEAAVQNSNLSEAEALEEVRRIFGITAPAAPENPPA